MHAIGKYIEGSGLDSIGIETGLYAPATIRQILSGKQYKRGLEFHITNALACYELIFEALDLAENVSDKCLHLKQMLHSKATNCDSVAEEISTSLPREKMETITASGELGKFLKNYVTQVEALLHLVRATRQCDWSLFLSALEEQVKYYFAHDLYKYAKYVPLHLAQMNEVKQNDPEKWQALESGDFAVARSGIPITDLFVDQHWTRRYDNSKW